MFDGLLTAFMCVRVMASYFLPIEAINQLPGLY